MTRRQIDRISLTLLALGFAAALAIFIAAPRANDDPFRNDPLASKKYLQQLRRIGGKGSEVAAEFNDWFAGLWHGRPLAGTVAVLVVGSTLLFRFVALHPDYLKGEPGAGKKGPPAPNVPPSPQ